MKHLMYLNDKHLGAIALLCSLLWQSCHAKLRATQEERAAEDTKQYEVETPLPTHVSVTLQPPAYLPESRTAPGQLMHPTVPIPTSLLLTVPHTLPAGSTDVPPTTRIQGAIAKLPARENIKQCKMPPERAASDAKLPAKKQKKTSADARFQEAPLTRVPEPAPQAYLSHVITRSVVPLGIHRPDKMPHVPPCTAPSMAQLPLDIRQRIFDDAVRHNLLNRVAFGKASWARYFGDVGASPALPPGIHTILTSPCPFWPDRMVYETHLLLLIPASVNGRPFSLNLLGELIQNPKRGGHRTQYRLYSSAVRSQLGKATLAHSYWVLVTRDVLAKSRGTSYANQQMLVAGYAGYYALPSTLEAATAILLHHVRTGERLFSDDPWMYMRCRDQIDWDDHLYPALIGGFSAGGLLVSDDGFDSTCLGVAGCRKL